MSSEPLHRAPLAAFLQLDQACRDRGLRLRAHAAKDKEGSYVEALSVQVGKAVMRQPVNRQSPLPQGIGDAAAAILKGTSW